MAGRAVERQNATVYRTVILTGFSIVTSASATFGSSGCDRVLKTTKYVTVSCL